MAGRLRAFHGDRVDTDNFLIGETGPSRGAGQKKKGQKEMAQPVTKSMDWDALWLTARERMRREMGDAVFDAWIRSLSFISAEGTDVKIGALTPFARNWVAGHHVQRIERALAAESGQAVTINLIVAPQRPSVAPVVTPPREPVVA
jgi:hypothetical protein